MVLVIDKKNSKTLASLISRKLEKRKSKGNLHKHFGKLKRNLDGLEYQSSLRTDED